MAKSKTILVLNAGSSSLKYALYEFADALKAKLAVSGLVEQIGTPKGVITHKALATNQTVHEKAVFSDHKEAMSHALKLMGISKGSSAVTAVGHRAVHGGEEINKSCIITEHVKDVLKKFTPLAPLHNPPNLQGMAVAQELLDCPQVAVFDTAFHSTIPPHAYTYALPYRLYKELGVRRYGFHGTSYMYLLRETARQLGKKESEMNMITLHLGAGASMACIKEGKCIDTTMGVTPLEGLVMATRCGDIDPAIPKILSDLQGLSPAQIDSLLNKESGLVGICGDKDMKAVVDRTEAAEAACIPAGDDLEAGGRHRLALEVFVHRVRKYLGDYLVQLGGKVDAIVFSAGIGERSAPVRARVCAGLEAFGIEVDKARNEEGSKGAREISVAGAKIKVMVVPTDEELCIAQETLRVVDEARKEE
ncbi:unnamed protein product [Closterium sp. NIES-53]